MNNDKLCLSDTMSSEVCHISTDKYIESDI